MTHALTVTKPNVVRTPERALRLLTCAMQRARYARVACCVRAGALALMFVCALAVRAGAVTAESFGTPLRWPLAGSARELRGGFGEPRAGHFHAGIDLSTGHHTGVEVLAPGAGTVERVRTSGVGYGRCLYLRVADRLLVFGHLDAFMPDLAAYVDSAQRATGEYDVDLWPAPGRFRVAAGERVAWSGESGAGPPHLHVEIRHGDFALNPLLAGLAVADTVPPRLERIVLEPLDEQSWVERSAAPRALSLRTDGETLLVEGRVRLTLRASDASNHARGLPVRTVGARWNGAWVECRMDSISWAGDMSQLGWLLDRGRVTGSDGVILDAPAGFRPRFLLSSRPDDQAVELVKVDTGAAPRPLELYARDAAGNQTTRRIWLRGPRWRETGPDTTRVSPLPHTPHGKSAHGKSAKARPRPASEPRWSFACLPDRRVRIRVTGTPGGMRDVRFERGSARPESSVGTPATWDGRGWSAVLDVSGTPDPDGFWLKGTGADGRASWHRGTYALWPTASPMVASVEDWAWFTIDAAHAYEPGVAMVRTAPITGLPAGAHGVRAAWCIEPAGMPLRKPVPVTLMLPAGVDPAHFGVYRRDADGDDWEWAGADWDSSRTFRVETGRLGEFALIRDDQAPEVVLRAAPARVRTTAYPKWELMAHAEDRLSGIAGRRCFITVDGSRVPTEWDPEARLLRWRPREFPRPGRHAYRVEVVDQAGNRTVKHGAFVITSP
jgi:hypothetical protein